MNREELVKLAREAGFTNPRPGDSVNQWGESILRDFWHNLDRFAQLVESKGQAAVTPEVTPAKVYILYWKHADNSGFGFAPHVYHDRVEAQRALDLLLQHAMEQWYMFEAEVV